MTPTILDHPEVDFEVLRLAIKNIEAEESNQQAFDLQSFCFNEQLQFIQDRSRNKVAVCSRRSGKTVACAAHLIHEALKNPDRNLLYITLSRLNAKRIVWGELNRIIRTHEIPAQTNESDLVVHFQNGSKIYLSGAKDKTEIEKFRGLALTLVYIDESQSFRSYIGELIDDVLAPALMDYAGTLCLIGTPGPIAAGYYHDAYHKGGWSPHQWTFFDNPHIAIKSGMSHQEILDAEIKRRGISKDDPSIQREWFGKWINDLDSLLIKYDPAKNHYDELPKSAWNHIVGIDIGFEDADAISVIAWRDHHKELYLVDEVITKKQGLTELIGQIERIRKKYNPTKMVMDEGGLGKKMAEEIRRRYSIPVHPADKKRKFENVELLNDMLRTGKFFAKRESRFAADAMLVEIDWEKTTPDRLVVSDSYHSDCIDSTLYAARECPGFSQEIPLVKPAPNTPQWYTEEQERIENAAVEFFTRQAEEESASDPFSSPFGEY